MDDCFIFIKAELQQDAELRNQLLWYEKVARQKVNPEKSEITCSQNMDTLMVTVFLNFLGMNPMNNHSKYLGMPMVVGSNKTEIFRGVEEKLGNRVQNWNNRMLSWAGREILVKSCLQAIPLYLMGCFKFPKSLCNILSVMALKFWWSGDTSHKVIHWIKKEIMQRDKLQGGWGSGVSRA